MPVIEQQVTYSSSVAPVNSTGAFYYFWQVLEEDGITPINPPTSKFTITTSTNASQFGIIWHTPGNYRLKLRINQASCNEDTDTTTPVVVIGDNVIPTQCKNFTYVGGSLGGTVSYTFCDGVSVETVAVDPGEQASLCCLESPAPVFTGTVTGNFTGDCNPTKTYNKDILLSYWLQDPNDFINCDTDSYLFPNCNPNGYNNTLASNGAKGRIKSYVNRGQIKPPFYATYHPVKTISTNDGSFGQTDYNVRFDQTAFDRTMAFCYEAGVTGIEFYFYDNDSDVGEHIDFNQNTTSPFALALKYCYALGGLGYYAKTTMDRIISHMAQDRYYKVGNRPVITIDAPQNSKFHVDRYIEQSGATWNVDSNEPGGGYWTQNPGYTGAILFSPASGFVRASGNTPNRRFIEYIQQTYSALHGGIIPYLVVEGTFFYYEDSENFGQDAISAYTLPHPDFNTDHSYQALINYNLSKLNSIPNKIVPTITSGISNLNINGQQPNYVDVPTDSELENHFELVNNWNIANPTKADFDKIYSLGETGEGGKAIFLPKKNPDGSIDKKYINILKKVLTT